MSKLSTLTTLYRQLPLSTFLKQVYFEITRRLCSPEAALSYGQFGDDLVIRHLLEINRPGFYVDIGCHYPITWSNTFELYKKGWHGLCIDGNSKCIAQYHHYRPKDTAICQCISNRSGRSELKVPVGMPAMGTISQDFAERELSHHVTESIVVETKTAETVFREQKIPNKFELLCIDVEGHDWEVLTSFDIREFSPSVIVIEIHGFDISAPLSNPICNYLCDNNYELVAYVALNAYFKKIKFQ